MAANYFELLDFADDEVGEAAVARVVCRKKAEAEAAIRAEAEAEDHARTEAVDAAWTEYEQRQKDRQEQNRRRRAMQYMPKEKPASESAAEAEHKDEEKVVVDSAGETQQKANADNGDEVHASESQKPTDDPEKKKGGEGDPGKKDKIKTANVNGSLKRKKKRSQDPKAAAKVEDSKEQTVQVPVLKKEEKRDMTLAEYQKMHEKKKSLGTSKFERRITTEEFEGLKMLKKADDDNKSDDGQHKGKEAAAKGGKARKAISINEYLKPAVRKEPVPRSAWPPGYGPNSAPGRGNGGFRGHNTEPQAYNNNARVRDNRDSGAPGSGYPNGRVNGGGNGGYSGGYQEHQVGGRYQERPPVNGYQQGNGGSYGNGNNGYRQGSSAYQGNGNNGYHQGYQGNGNNGYRQGGSYPSNVGGHQQGNSKHDEMPKYDSAVDFPALARPVKAAEPAAQAPAAQSAAPAPSNAQAPSQPVALAQPNAQAKALPVAPAPSMAQPRASSAAPAQPKAAPAPSKTTQPKASAMVPALSMAQPKASVMASAPSKAQPRTSAPAPSKTRARA